MGARLAAEANKAREQTDRASQIATIDLFVLPTICFKLLHGLVIPKTDDDLEVQICPAAEAANE